jgi:hypothetical protein
MLRTGLVTLRRATLLEDSGGSAISTPSAAREGPLPLRSAEGAGPPKGRWGGLFGQAFRSFRAPVGAAVLGAAMLAAAAGLGAPLQAPRPPPDDRVVSVDVSTLKKPTSIHIDHNGIITVDTDASPRDLEDRVTILGPGSFDLDTGIDGYSAGYVAIKDSPLKHRLGTPVPSSFILSDAANKANTRSPVEKLDDVFTRNSPNAPSHRNFLKRMFSSNPTESLVARYGREGVKANPKYWEGFCDRWIYSALNPNIASRVNVPRAYKGTFFSVAELRGLSSFLGRSDEGGGMLIMNPSARQLFDAIETLLSTGGPGFGADIYDPSAHGGTWEVWNQGFSRASQTVTEQSDADASAIAKATFGLDSLQGKKIDLVSVAAKYYSEARSFGAASYDNYEGPTVFNSRQWNFYVLTDAGGAVVDVKFAPGSDEKVMTIFVPGRTGHYASPEAAFFFNSVLADGVDLSRVTQFEETIQAKLAEAKSNPELKLGDREKQDLRARFAGIRNAYPDSDLDQKLAPLGLHAADF